MGEDWTDSKRAAADQKSVLLDWHSLVLNDGKYRGESYETLFDGIQQTSEVLCCGVCELGGIWMSNVRHVLVNALSVGGGGGVTVARELSNQIARLRPEAVLTVALNPGYSLHQELSQGLMGSNIKLLECPNTRGVVRRDRYERKQLIPWSLAHNVDAVVQLNGMVIPGMPLPTLAHCQNPFPFQPMAWNGLRDRVTSAFKRRAQARAFAQAAFVGWTSQYLCDLICGWLGKKPARHEVFYNGVPDEWMNSSDADHPSLDSRPLEILSVSNVEVYKRQELVIRAMPLLVSKPGLESLIYRIVGAISPGYKSELNNLAHRLGVGDRVVIEGRVDDAHVADRYRRARCCILMSVCESFGIPAVEAMSFGAPVVVCRACALPEICGDAAEYVPADDVVTLASAIHRVVTESNYAKILRSRGFARIRKFPWSEPAARMAEVLDEIARPA